jgi:dTDP-4-amino-4,6-dideoxygalactose transaminase
MEVPFVGLQRQFHVLHDDLFAAFERVGASGMYIMGEELERFEAEAARYCGTRHALGVANGSDALFLALKALGIGAGDEVITCPNSFIASASVIVAAGARPVFVDAGDDYNIDVDKLEVAITPHTRAIIPVHLTGRPADMDAVGAIAAERGIAVLEDAAQAIGARYRGRRVGSLGTAAGFSLHPLKNLGVYGDGGLITTDDSQLFARLSKLRNHGLRNRDECEMWGYNSRLDPLQAAFAAVKLKHLDAWNVRCREIAARYRQGLREIVWVPFDRDYEEPVYHNFVIQLDRRDALIEHLNACGVGTRIHYPIPIHLQPCAAELGHRAGDFPVAERYARTILSLPIYPELTQPELDHVIASVRSFFGASSSQSRLPLHTATPRALAS